MILKMPTLFMVFAGTPALAIAASQDHHDRTMKDPSNKTIQCTQAWF